MSCDDLRFFSFEPSSLKIKSEQTSGGQCQIVTRAKADKVQTLTLTWPAGRRKNNHCTALHGGNEQHMKRNQGYLTYLYYVLLSVNSAGKKLFQMRC